MSRSIRLCLGLIIASAAAFASGMRASAQPETRGTTRPAQPSSEPAGAPTTAPTDVHVLHIEATIDGSDVVTVTARGVHWQHKSWSWPGDVRINNVVWIPKERPDLPGRGVLAFLGDVDFAKARVIGRSGRDVVAMETIDDGIAIYFADAPMDAARYTIRIALPRK